MLTDASEQFIPRASEIASGYLQRGLSAAGDRVASMLGSNRSFFEMQDPTRGLISDQFNVDPEALGSRVGNLLSETNRSFFQPMGDAARGLVGQEFEVDPENLVQSASAVVKSGAQDIGADLTGMAEDAVGTVANAADSAVTAASTAATSAGEGLGAALGETAGEIAGALAPADAFGIGELLTPLAIGLGAAGVLFGTLFKHKSPLPTEPDAVYQSGLEN
jgi:hypothetical protein